MAYRSSMLALERATMFCRMLLGLDRARATGALRLDGEGRRAILWLDAGAVVAANVDRRVALSRLDVLERALAICRWDGLELKLSRQPLELTWWKLAAPVAAGEVALNTMRATANSLGTPALRAELGNALYHLTPLGEQLAVVMSWKPSEAAALTRLARGASAEHLAELSDCGPEALRMLWALKLLRAVAPKAAGSSFPLLLRKRRELRRSAPPHALLDLPEGANGRAARLALRRLVRDLHPDRFGEGAPADLRRASGEVVSALVEAEAMIARRPGR